MKISNLFLYFSPLLKFKISGNSMQPIFKNGDIILINKLSYFLKSPKINDIVAIKNPTDNNGKRYIIKRIVKIKNNGFFVEGDNKKESTDSREFGLIKRKNILGKVV